MSGNKLKPAIDMVLFLLGSHCSKNHVLYHLLELHVPFKNSNSFEPVWKAFLYKMKAKWKAF